MPVLIPGGGIFHLKYDLLSESLLVIIDLSGGSAPFVDLKMLCLDGG